MHWCVGHWPIQVLDYLKSPKGALGKTAGCFRLLAKDATTQLQPAALPDQVNIENGNAMNGAKFVSSRLLCPWTTLPAWPRVVQPCQGEILINVACLINIVYAFVNQESTLSTRLLEVYTRKSCQGGLG